MKCSPGFFVDILNTLHGFNCDTIICGGDLNVVFNLELDKKGGNPRTNFRAREKCFELMFSHDLVDIWRERNPFTKNFTWSSNVTPGIHCRLDYFLISRHVNPSVIVNSFSPGFLSDHSFVYLTIGTEATRRGPGYWKLNNSLLCVSKYIGLTHELIRNHQENNASYDL